VVWFLEGLGERVRYAGGMGSLVGFFHDIE